MAETISKHLGLEAVHAINDLGAILRRINVYAE